MAERIKEAREFGDISENSEYDDAKNEQAMLEQQIAQLEERLRSAQVVDTSDLSTDVVQIGVDRPRQGREDRRQSTSTRSSARPRRTRRRSKLSNESPVGKALLGHKRGDTVDVSLPSGKKRKLKITKIDVA